MPRYEVEVINYKGEPHQRALFICENAEEADYVMMREEEWPFIDPASNHYAPIAIRREMNEHGPRTAS